MAFTAEGTIEINTEDFFVWLYNNHAPVTGVLYQYGVPRVNKSNGTIEIDFAMDSECNPVDWIEKPKVCKQWENLNEHSS
ncbi:hypothetical protein b3_0159 [Synechococcus phage B3]|nr:hypothetical protein b3_0159 [Synechococcus phage B3]QGT54773.1 hypothetical protein b23_0158 [Synechococcus phage B23]